MATILFVGLIGIQLYWVFDAAKKQEAQFNKRTQLALSNIEEKVIEDEELTSSVNCCLVEDGDASCKSVMGKDPLWEKTDSMISAELNKFDIDLEYDFDFCYTNPDGSNKFEAYERNMDKVFDESGIVLFLEFPDKSKFLRNQIGPIFISAILLIVFLSILFVIIYRFYKRERQFSTKTREFINNMTHEFKTPLTNIALANSMISRGQKDDPKVKQYTRIIEEENERLAKNCDDLLQMAKIENAELILNEQVDAHQVITEVINSKRLSVEDKVMHVDLQLQASDYSIKGSESLFYNTISNLVDNALKYSKEELNLQVQTKNVEDALLIKIIDNGIGMSSEDIPHIFDKFYRIANTDQHDVKGFGLGLSFVKMVITKMKGHIQVDSKLGAGTTFNIKLPIAKNA